jgi:hypothetical protein
MVDDYEPKTYVMLNFWMPIIHIGKYPIDPDKYAANYQKNLLQHCSAYVHALDVQSLT